MVSKQKNNKTDKYDISKMIIYNICSSYCEIIFYSFLWLWFGYGQIIVFSVLGLALIIIVIHRFKNQDAYLEKDAPKKYIQDTGKNQKSNFNINLQLQAYERLTIFLSRIDPWRLLSLVNISEKNIKLVESSLLQIIVSEFEYNLSQQVYVSDHLWELIELSKKKTIQLILSVKTGLSKDATGQEFYIHLEEILKTQNITPSKITLDYLKKEVRKI